MYFFNVQELYGAVFVVISMGGQNSAGDYRVRREGAKQQVNLQDKTLNEQNV